MSGPRASIASITHKVFKVASSRPLALGSWDPEVASMGVAKVAETRGPVNAGGRLNRQKDSTHWARRHGTLHILENRKPIG